MEKEEALRVCQQELQRMIRDTGVTPATLINYGNMAEQAVRNPQMKKRLYEDALNRGVIDKSEFPQGLKVNDLAMFVVIGKLAQQMGGA